MLGSALTVFGQDNWPSFRGPGACGIADEVTPAVWNVTNSRNIVWKTPLPGLGHSSPVIWGDKLFVTTAVNGKRDPSLKVGYYGDVASSDDSETQQWRVICLNKKSGQILWQATAHEGMPHVKRHPKATHANCTAATDGTNLLAFFGSEGLYCYDLEGHLRWTKDLGVLRANPSVYNDRWDTNLNQWEWGFASSPVIYAGRGFVQCDVLGQGFVAAFDIHDGREIWRAPRNDTATWSTPNVCVAGLRPQLVVNGWRQMAGYDLQTGGEIWHLSGGGDCPVPTPLMWSNIIFLTSAHGPRKPVFAVKADAAGDIAQRAGEHMLWSTNRGGAYMATPIVCDGRLYTCDMDGLLHCFDAATGRLFYKDRLGAGGDSFTSSPVASRGKIYFASEQGLVYVLQPGPQFKVIATNRLEESCLATPAISEGTLFYRTQTQIIAIAEKQPSP
jgi:outer membrane protein assembly factor BamB